VSQFTQNYSRNVQSRKPRSRFPDLMVRTMTDSEFRTRLEQAPEQELSAIGLELSPAGAAYLKGNLRASDAALLRDGKIKKMAAVATTVSCAIAAGTAALPKTEDAGSGEHEE